MGGAPEMLVWKDFTQTKILAPEEEHTLVDRADCYFGSCAISVSERTSDTWQLKVYDEDVDVLSLSPTDLLDKLQLELSADVLSGYPARAFKNDNKGNGLMLATPEPIHFDHLKVTVKNVGGTGTEKILGFLAHGKRFEYR